jgi:tryptophanyl-tRNA synthetase
MWGSLKNRFEMQDAHQCFFMIADYQALTTHQERSQELETHVREMVLDYLAAGFDPEKSVCFLQSQVPQLAELTMILSNLVSLPRLLRNPTIKEEMDKMGLEGRATYGFVGYPVSQAADILLFRPRYIPVGPDQRPHIELAQDVAGRFNRLYGDVFPIPEGVYGERLIGCTTCKEELAMVLNDFLTPFRERRAEFEQQPNLVRDILHLGCSRARIEGQRTLEMVKEAMGLRYKDLLG